MDVPATHPASTTAPVAVLPPVGAMLASDEPTPAAVPAEDPHAHHHHHHGAGGGEKRGDRGGAR